MKILVFDITGDYGHFKKPYSPMSPVTFPLPPPPTVMGIIGAIIGLSKNEYHHKLGWNKIKIGIRLLAPVKILRSALNLLNTKDGTDKFLRPRAHANTHTPVNFEFLKDPSFRIYVGALPSGIHNTLKNMLKDQRSVYTPTLGLAQCIADIKWVGEITVRRYSQTNAFIHTAIALTGKLVPKYQPGRRYHRTRIPAVMDGERVVHRYQEILLTDDAGPIECELLEDSNIYQVENETISFL